MRVWVVTKRWITKDAEDVPESAVFSNPESAYACAVYFYAEGMKSFLCEETAAHFFECCSLSSHQEQFEALQLFRTQVWPEAGCFVHIHPKRLDENASAYAAYKAHGQQGVQLSTSEREELQALIETVEVQAGAFLMGASERKEVILSRSFHMMTTPVTQKLYEFVMKENPSHFKGAKLPVECVSWFNTIAFSNTLSEMQGLDPVYYIERDSVKELEEANGWRLPTEAEWEYAARAGADELYAGGNELALVGWYWDNSDFRTHEVAMKRANSWGLYDMSGNVWEWCWDWYQEPASERGEHQNTRIRRGGSWLNYTRDAQVGSRNDLNPERKNRALGFRLCRYE